MTTDRPVGLEAFLGDWTLSRVIRHGDGATARFEGRACWSPAPDGADYYETGQILLPGHAPMQAERRYFWDRALNVYFEDGRFFHQMPDRGGAAAHWCDPDQYDAQYDFADWPVFTVRWSVRGPRKDYVMDSRYARAPGAA